jgi:hypothetical protein
VIGWSPLHVPCVVVSAWPSTAWPEIVGGAVFEGAYCAIAAVWFGAA